MHVYEMMKTRIRTPKKSYNSFRIRVFLHVYEMVETRIKSQKKSYISFRISVFFTRIPGIQTFIVFIRNEHSFV